MLVLLHRYKKLENLGIEKSFHISYLKDIIEEASKNFPEKRLIQILGFFKRIYSPHRSI